MKELVDVIKRDAQYLGNGIVKMDSFLNHQVDVGLCEQMGKHFHEAFNDVDMSGITKVITAETSGIPAALFTAREYGVPMLFARKHVSAVMNEVYYFAKTISRTKGNETNLFISKRFIDETDKVLIIDDFLATGNTLHALSNIISESGAQLLGLGAIIEKPQEAGREKLGHLTAPIVSLAKVTWLGEVMSVE
ncbi:MAG: xanthine phosphoribosyltransferase [Saprospiraceae bacterium]